MRTISILFTSLLVACASSTPNEPEKGDPGEMGEMGTPGTSGVSCWDLDSSLSCNLETEDYNDDGVCDVGDCFGVEGPAGPAGPSGPQGPQGPAGATGPAGPIGPMGPMGPMGPQGNTGAQGPAGPQGPQGTQGPTGAQGPVGPAGTTGQLGAAAFSTGSLSLTSAVTTFTAVPGASVTVTVPTNAIVFVTADGGLQTSSTSTTGFSTIDIGLHVDGAVPPNGGFKRIIAANTGGLTAMLSAWSVSLVTSISAGSHTFSIRGRYNAGSTATLGGDNQSVNQISIAVTVLKL